MTKFTKLFCTAFLLLAGGVSASAQEDEIIDFDASFYHNWSEVSATATDNGEAGGGVVIGEEVGLGGTIWGNLLGAVPYLCYANITEYSELRFEGTPGAVIRLMCNRVVDEGPIYEIKPTIPEDGKLTVAISDLKFLNGGTPCDFVCLQSIKVPAGWQGGTTAATITSIKIVKPGDPLSIPKEELKNAINTAKMQSSFAKTEDSWNALQQAIAAGEAAMTAADATAESLTAAKQAIEQAVANLQLIKGYSNLTGSMFKHYASVEEPGEGTDLGCTPELFKASGLPYGDGNVSELNWADLTNYQTLVVTTVGTVKPRFCLNRLEAGGQQAATMEESKMLDINPNNDFTWSTEKYLTAEEGIYTLDLTKIVADYGFARLHCIKKQGWGDGVIVTGMYLAPVPEDIEISPAEGDIAAALAAAVEGKKVGNITINLTAGAAYTVSATLTAPNNLTINGNGATVDASALTAPFITIDGTEVFAMKDAETASDHKYVALDSISALTITGLQDALIKDAQKTLLETFVIEDCNIQMPAAGKNVVDFNSKGYVGRVSVVNSTIWAAGMNTGFFAQYGSRPKNINGDWLQQFVFENNTIVNIANGKNFNDMKQNGTAQNVYTLKNNIFVNSGKDKQVVVGFNKGQASATPVWDVDGNYFMVGDACTNADEIAKAGKQGEEDIVKNCAEGLLTFTDAAAGNFNGEFTPAEGAEAPESLGDPRWTIETVIPVTHTWDFTKWSEATVTNLKAEAAKVEVMDDPDNEGNTLLVSDNDALWSDHEKAKDKTCDTYAASKDNCFWYIGGEAEPTANGEAIAELKGLQFNASYGTSRSLAIAVNYPSTALGEYAGPSYLWFGGKGKECFTIPSVKGGTTITMGVESHKIAEGRGVQLLVDGTALNDPEGNPVAAPTTYTEQTWQVPEGAAVDVLVKNTNGCHIYFIDAEIDETPVGINDIQQSVVKSDVIYNLNGQQVKNAQKGLYIINGKKVIVK